MAISGFVFLTTGIESFPQT